MNKREIFGASVAPPQRDYRPDIDGLRAIAVISVIVFHAFPNLLPGGFVGVDIFFVISGYLIGGHILKSLADGTFSILDFYRRRIRRIFPALIVVLGTCLAFGWVALLASEYAQLGKHVTASSAFLANLAFWREAGYFDNSSATKPLLHLWSLGVEEQFYILWPALAWVAWRLRKNLTALIVGAATISMLMNLLMVGSDPAAAFYSPLTRFWELLAGAGLAQFETGRRAPLSARSSNAAGWLGAILIAGGVFLIDEHHSFPGLSAAIPAAGAALVIMAGPTAIVSRTALSAPLSTAIGMISYPLYLWHWPLLSFAYIIGSSEPSPNITVLLIVCSFLLASATYLLVEKPIRFGRWRRAPLALPLCGLMVALGAAGLVIYLLKGVPERSAAAEGAAVAAQFVGPEWPYATNENCMTRYPFTEAAEFGWWFCMLQKDAPATILVTGGSFANQLYPGLARNNDLERQNVLSIGTCAPLYVAPGSENGPKTAYPCSGSNWVNQHALIDGILDREKSIRTVIVDGLRSSGAPVDIDRIVSRLAQLARPDVQVIVFLPHYRVDFDVRGCFGRPFAEPRFSCDIPRGDYEALISSNAALEREIKNRLPQIMFFEQNTIFCLEDRCSLVHDGLPLVRDEWHHISEHASNLVAEAFVAWAEKNCPAILER